MQLPPPRTAHGALVVTALSLAMGCGGSADATAQDGTRADELTGENGSGNDAEQAESEASEGASTAATCIAQYPPSLPFDIGSTFAPRSGPGVEAVALDCRLGGGKDCDAQRFISMQAALCIAEQEVTRTPSERGRRAGLAFAESMRVEWSVAVEFPSPFSPQDPYCQGLTMLDIDAMTGLVRNEYFLEACA